MLEELDLKTIFDKAIANHEELQRHYSETLYGTTIALLQECQRRVSSLALFSVNETVEDLQTASIKYIFVGYFLGRVYSTFRTKDLTARLTVLQLAQSSLDGYLGQVLSYGLLDEDTRSLCLLGQNDEKAEALEVPREIRIGRHQQIMALQRQYDECSTIAFDDNEEAEREKSSILVRLRTIEAVNALDSIETEIRLLARHLGNQQEQEKLPVQHSQSQVRPSMKVTQPFTIVKDRQQMTRNVFKPGHSLPTMTIDEYLELEKKRGGVLDESNANQQSSHGLDEDDEDCLEAERQKNIRFDLFKDHNPRGWGNTSNLG